VLDLVYEARDIDQRLGSMDKIDAWFEAKTKGLNDWQKDELKTQWGTMQHVLSSKSRMDRVVSDIIFDFSVKPRLSSERAMPSWWRRASMRRASISACFRRHPSRVGAPW